MKLSDLIRDEATGGMSHTRVWSNIGYAAMTAGFLKVVWMSTATEGLAWLFGVYGGIVGGSQIASKLIGLKFGSKDANGGAVTKEGKT